MIDAAGDSMYPTISPVDNIVIERNCLLRTNLASKSLVIYTENSNQQQHKRTSK
jgi:phage repressor protein C with HTH and peptisase S24 domain